MDIPKLLNLLRRYSIEITNGNQNETKAQDLREKRVTKDLLTFLLERKPTEDEIRRCLPW